MSIMIILFEYYDIVDGRARDDHDGLRSEALHPYRVYRNLGAPAGGAVACGRLAGGGCSWG